MTPRAATTLRSAFAGLVMCLAFGVTTAHAQLAGVYRTPKGYNAPAVGLFAVTRPDGTLGVECRVLDGEALALRQQMAATSAARTITASQNVPAPENGLGFQVNFTDPPAFGFDDALLGAQRRAAMLRTAEVWGSVLSGPVPVVIEANFFSSPLPILAFAGPTDFTSVNGQLVPFALAAQLNSTSANGGTSDLQISFNDIFDWSYALDGAPGGGFSPSFVYTALHEVCHGLGYLASINPTTGEFEVPGQPLPFDRFLNLGSNQTNLLINRTAAERLMDVVSNNLFFNGPNANVASVNSIRPLPMIKLYAPPVFESGSSVSHVDQDTYADLRVGLMTPADFGRGNDEIDPLTQAIMQDLGYLLRTGSQTGPTPTPDPLATPTPFVGVTPVATLPPGFPGGGRPVDTVLADDTQLQIYQPQSCLACGSGAGMGLLAVCIGYIYMHHRRR